MKTIRALILMVGCLMICGAPAATWASSIDYNVDFSVVGAGSVSGFIQTDGTIGSLSTANITDWNLLLNDGVSTFDLLGPVSGPNSAVEVGGISLTATATNLLFDFSNTSLDFVLFQSPSIHSGMDFLCMEGNGNGCSGNPSSLNLATALGFSNIQVLPETGDQVVGTVGTVPEPGSLLLLGTGLLGMLGAMRRKRLA